MDWKTAKVNIDYHVEVDRHFYSVSHQLIGEQVDVRLGTQVVELEMIPVIYCGKFPAVYR